MCVKRVAIFASRSFLPGHDTAVGLFQVRQLDSRFDAAEWGFALASEYWGSGLFHEGADAVLRFVFDVVGVTRLEARAVVETRAGTPHCARSVR